jgi:hypothetical protein
MAENRCEQCGSPITQPRGGSRPKRFCSGACRARHNRGRPKTARKAVVALEGEITAARRLADLEELYRLLKADVEKHGTQVDGKLNPSVAELRRVSVEIGRLTRPAAEPEEEETISSVLGLVK